MSMRDHFYSVTSIEPIRGCVGSLNSDLVESVVEQWIRDNDDDPDEEVEFRDSVRSMVMCHKAPRKEPGCWYHILPYVAESLGLAPRDDLPINEGWKHNHVWPPYRKLLRRYITRSARKSLAHLDDGRPLQGKRLDYDGCVFSWLTVDEVQELHGLLSRLDLSVISNADLVDFHNDLIESLEKIASESKDLLAGA